MPLKNLLPGKIVQDRQQAALKLLLYYAYTIPAWRNANIRSACKQQSFSSVPEHDAVCRPLDLTSIELAPIA